MDSKARRRLRVIEGDSDGIPANWTNINDHVPSSRDGACSCMLILAKHTHIYVHANDAMQIKMSSAYIVIVF